MTTASPARRPPSARAALRKGLVNSLANPKLAAFFVSLFPQFVAPGHRLLPAAVLMACAVVGFDVVWYGAIAYVVDRTRRAIAPALLRRLQRGTGAVLVGFGVRLATETR